MSVDLNPGPGIPLAEALPDPRLARALMAHFERPFMLYNGTVDLMEMSACLPEEGMRRYIAVARAVRSHDRNGRA